MKIKFPFWLIALAIISLPTMYYFELPRWLLLIPTSFLVFVFGTITWYVIRRK